MNSEGQVRCETLMILKGQTYNNFNITQRTLAAKSADL